MEAWAVFERCALPRLNDFGPSLLFLSCGFDGIEGDPTEAETLLTPPWFGRVAEACVGLGVPVVATLQGGYLAEGVGAAAESVLGVLAGRAGAAEVGSGSVERAEEVVAAVEAALEDREGWFSVDRSFNHGLEGDDDSDEQEQEQDQEQDQEQEQEQEEPVEGDDVIVAEELG